MSAAGVKVLLLRGPQHTRQGPLTPSLSHPMGEGAQRAGEGDGVAHPTDSSVNSAATKPSTEGDLGRPAMLSGHEPVEDDDGNEDDDD